MSSGLFLEFRDQPLEVVHVGVGVDSGAPTRVGLPLPLEEAAAGRVVLALQKRRAVLAHEPHDQGVGEGERVLNLVPDDSGRPDPKTPAGDSHCVDPAGVAEFIHQCRVAGFRFFAEQAGDDGAVGAMPPAGRAETAVEVGLDGDGRVHEVRPALQDGAEIGRDSQWRYRVRTGRPGPNLEQVLQRNADRSDGNPLIAALRRRRKNVPGNASGKYDIGPSQQFEASRRKPGEPDEPTPNS